jgi:catecholate siderophore receptor
MTKTTSIRTSTGFAFLALGCVGAFTAPALAADAADAASAPDKDDIVVRGNNVRAEIQSEKIVAPLLDTPQTVTVISDQVLRKQNLLTLRDALQSIPGITFGAGEGGGGYGDAINLRGYSASNDITIDGVRDSAQYSRTDPFNLQQIEVYNGANSVYSGSGSVGGTINLASKTPQRDNLTIVSAAGGTDEYYRGTVDTNLRVNDLVAFRLNAMYHHNRVPGRGVETYERWGVAPSLTIGIDSPTSLTLSYFHQHDNNTPIYGVPYFRNELNNGPLPGIDDSDYFGIVNLDKQLTDVDRLTAKFKHEFSDHVSITNTTRWQRVAQYSQTSAPQGTFCLPNGTQPVPTYASVQAGTPVGAACTVSIQNAVYNGVYLGNVAPNITVPNAHSITVTPGFFQPNGPRGLVRDQLNDLFYNQTDLRIENGEKGGFHNTLVLGAAFSWEDYSITTASLIRNAAGQALVLPQFDYSNPNTVYTGPLNYTVTAQSKSHTMNKAFYAFDNLEINDQFEINGGIRWENNKAQFRAIPLAVIPPGTNSLNPAELDQQSDENLFSWRVGAVYKPVQNVSIYAAVANAQTPSSSTVRLGCTSGSGATFTNFCDVAPEKARSYEIGVKADVGKVQLTAAVFRNERTNFRVPSNDVNQPAGTQVLGGRSRVDGIALGATGYITPRWVIFANYTYLNGRVLRSVSATCLATPSPACLNSNTVSAVTTTIADPQQDDRLIQTPEHSASLFTSYKFPFGLELGYGINYQGAFALNQRTLYGRTQFYSDGYVTHRLLVSYEIKEGLTAQLNVQNLFDKKYYTAIRNNIGTSLTGGGANNGVVNGGWATPGEGRSAVFSLFYNF